MYMGLQTLKGRMRIGRCDLDPRIQWYQRMDDLRWGARRDGTGDLIYIFVDAIPLSRVLTVMSDATMTMTIGIFVYIEFLSGDK